MAAPGGSERVGCAREGGFHHFRRGLGEPGLA